MTASGTKHTSTERSQIRSKRLVCFLLRPASLRSNDFVSRSEDVFQVSRPEVCTSSSTSDLPNFLKTAIDFYGCCLNQLYRQKMCGIGVFSSPLQSICAIRSKQILATR